MYGRGCVTTRFQSALELDACTNDGDGCEGAPQKQDKVLQLPRTPSLGSCLVCGFSTVCGACAGTRPCVGEAQNQCVSLSCARDSACACALSTSRDAPHASPRRRTMRVACVLNIDDAMALKRTCKGINVLATANNERSLVRLGAGVCRTRNGVRACSPASERVADRTRPTCRAYLGSRYASRARHAHGRIRREADAQTQVDRAGDRRGLLGVGLFPRG